MVFSKFTRLFTQKSEQEPIDEVIADKNYVVALRSNSLAVYALAIAGGSRVLNPRMVHTFQWAVDNCSLVSQSHPSSNLHSETDISFVNILIRFSSGFPWPVNVIHHYTLRLPPATSAAALDPILSLQQVISAPVRLFSTADMTIGTFGTAVWMDTHTEDYFGSADGQATGQRLVGLSLRRVNPPAPPHQAVPTSVATTTFRVNDEKNYSWVKVAVDEREGKLGVADSIGNISIYEYA